MPDLLLRGGRPWGVDTPADVLIREGVIEAIGPDLRADPAAEVVDVPGRLLLPASSTRTATSTRRCSGGAGCRTRRDRL
jgi:hypothetical protein